MQVNNTRFIYYKCWDKMAAISQTRSLFSCMEAFVLSFTYHWTLLTMIMLTCQHQVRQWLGAKQATCHYLNQNNVDCTVIMDGNNTQLPQDINETTDRIWQPKERLIFPSSTGAWCNCNILLKQWLLPLIFIFLSMWLWQRSWPSLVFTIKDCKVFSI